jgi:GT2 family glycosyltransferase
MKITCGIVLYHNDVEEIRKPIESLMASPFDIQIYLVDNSRTDALRYAFKSDLITYIFTGKNIGFGAAHNIAIERAKANSYYHLVLNPDVEFSPDIIERLFLFMERNRDVGLVMPKVLYRNGDLQYLCKKLPAPTDLFVRRFLPAPLKTLFKKQLESYELKHLDYHVTMDVPNLSGCFMFIRTSVFQTVGYFDEQYFLYMEDTDMCRRINQYYRTVYYPDVTIIHGYNKASYRNFSLLRCHLNSSIRYFNKWGWFSDGQRAEINNSVLNGTHNNGFPTSGGRRSQRERNLTPA